MKVQPPPVHWILESRKTESAAASGLEKYNQNLGVSVLDLRFGVFATF